MLGRLPAVIARKFPRAAGGQHRASPCAAFGSARYFAVPRGKGAGTPDGKRGDSRASGDAGRLKQEHRDLDSAINALEESGRADALQLKRLKKKKLFLRDEISRIEDQLLPDIIA